MEISQIKAELPIKKVLGHYGLKPDKHQRLRCPFHDDKTPSLQVYYKTQTCYCFSSNCPTHGRSLDVIDFIMHKEQLTKREAILKAKALIGGTGKGVAPQNKPLSRELIVQRIFTYFKNGIYSSGPAQEYLSGRGLDYRKTEVGYNSGQFHHGKRKDKALIEGCVRCGLLLDLGNTSRTGNRAYKPFGKWGVVFPLRDRDRQIVGLYFRSILEDKKQRHFYLKNRQGLYPGYPGEETRRLILTESIIDAATLLEQEKIKAHYQVLALYGTNGLTQEHQKAIQDLQELEEIVFFLNGDQAGIKAVEKYAPALKGEYPEVKITHVQVPEGEDVNSLLQGHSPDLLIHLIEDRKEYDFLLLGGKPEGADIFLSTESERLDVPIKSVEKEKPERAREGGLDTNNPYNLKFTGREAQYQIKGFSVGQPDSLKITLQITSR
ncbi:MAG: toprim domain-containing protein [Flavobacteriales bacterium]|nr:toprim domain-containing protein [Flavobacteriales bacterium]